MPGRTRLGYLVVVLVASRVGWSVYEFVFRHYGPGTVSGTLLSASPEAAAAAGIAWLMTTTVLSMAGIALVHLLR